LLGDVAGAAGMTGIDPVPIPMAVDPRLAAAAAGTGGVLGAAGRALTGGETASIPGWLGEVWGCAALRLGSEPRPGGGGGFEAVGGAGGADGAAARIEPDAGPEAADGGRGGGAEIRPPEAGGEEGIAEADEGAPPFGFGLVEAAAGGTAGRLPWLGGCAGPGIPMRVRFMSAPGGGGAAGTCEAEPGGGGGAADVRPTLFLPRPSKISRSEPLLLSSDIRVS